MPKAFASGKKSNAICDRCGFRYKYNELRYESVSDNQQNIRVCPTCWDPDHPQNDIGEQNFSDPQALRNPRPQSDLTLSRYGDSVRYEFDSTVEDFTGSDASVAWSSDKTIVLTGTGDDPQLIRDGNVSSPVSIDSSIYKRVACRLKLNTRPDPLYAWAGQFYWARSTDGLAYDTTRVKSVQTPDWFQMGDPWHTLVWDLSSESNWTGTIVGVRFDFFDFQSLSRVSGEVLELDYIRFERRVEWITDSL